MTATAPAINFTPLRDLILVLPDPEPDKIGSIVVPAGSLPQGHKPGPSEHCFIGTVVAVGPGDRITKCEQCGGTGRVTISVKVTDTLGSFGYVPCQKCEPRGYRHPMYVKPGDRVVYPRRPSAPGGDCDVVIDGVRYLMFHEEQNAYAVVVGD